MTRRTPRFLRGHPAAALVALLGLLWALPAAAYDYSTTIRIDSEEDLDELYYAGLIDEEEYEQLVELLHNPLDVNVASREELYGLPGVSQTAAAAIVRHREMVGPFESEFQLISLPGIGDEVYEQIRPFLEEMPPIHRKTPVKGVLTLRGGKTLEQIDPIENDSVNRTHQPEDLGFGQIPDFYLRGQVTVDRWLELGFLGLAQEEIARVHYDPASHDFVAGWGAPVFELDKAFISAKGSGGSGIVGSYSAGFGRRLTFDVTQRAEPHGWYRDLQVQGEESFSPPQRLFGGAARLTALRFGRSSLDMTLFGSSRLYDLYQYHMGFDTGGEDTDSPRIYMQDQDGQLQRMGWLTMPNVYREDLVGGNVTFRINNRSHVGVTGYVAHIDKTVIEGVDDNDEWLFRYRIPNRDYFGAVGADFMFGLGMLALSGEYSHDDKTGNALLLQANLSRPRLDLDLVFRHYDTDWSNPHSRGVAQSDVYEGARARDETGFRFKGYGSPLPWLQLRGTADIWERPSTGLWNLQLYGKVDVLPTDQLRLAAFTRWTNKDLARNGRGWEYGGSSELDQWQTDSASRYDDVEPEDWYETEGHGAKTQVGGQLDVEYIPATHLTLYYQRYYEDVADAVTYPTGDGPCEPWFQVGNYFWVKARVRPGKMTTLTWRFKYLDEDVHGDRGERSFETYLQFEQKVGRPPRPRMKFVIRGTLGRYLADPAGAWEYDCSIAGIPQLVDGGTCLATELTEPEDEPPEEKWYGQIWGALEFRF